MIMDASIQRLETVAFEPVNTSEKQDFLWELVGKISTLSDRLSEVIENEQEKSAIIASNPEKRKLVQEIWTARTEVKALDQKLAILNKFRVSNVDQNLDF